MSQRSGDPDSSGEELFKNHKVLFTIRPYGHGPGAPGCPHYAKQTQFPQANSQKMQNEPNPSTPNMRNEPNLPYRWRLAGIPTLHYAKQTQSPYRWHLAGSLYAKRTQFQGQERCRRQRGTLRAGCPDMGTVAC